MTLILPRLVFSVVGSYGEHTCAVLNRINVKTRVGTFDSAVK